MLIDCILWRTSFPILLVLFSVALLFFSSACALDPKLLGVNTTELKDDAKAKGTELGWSAAGAAYQGLADSMNGAGDVRSEPLVANEQLPPPPTDGCKPSPQPMNFRVAFEIGSQSLKRLATTAGMNQMIPPAAAGTQSTVGDRLKENYGNQMFSTLANAVTDVGIGFVVGTFKGIDLLGSNSLANSNKDLSRGKRTRSIGRSVGELIEDAYQRKDDQLSAIGEMIHRNENGKFIFGDESRLNEEMIVNNHHDTHRRHADSLQNGGLSSEKKAALLGAYDALLEKSGTDLELKDSMTRGVKAFNWPRVIPDEHAEVVTNDHHHFASFIKTMRTIIHETEPGAFVLDGVRPGENSSWTNPFFHSNHPLTSNDPLSYFSTNGLSDLNCNTIPFHPDGNYFVTAIFASIPSFGQFKFCFALNTCDQMAAIAFTPKPLAPLFGEPIKSVVKQVEGVSVAISLKSNLSITFVPFWQGEARPMYAAKMGGTLGLYIKLTPELAFLNDLKELFELEIEGIAMIDLDPNRDGGLASTLAQVFTNPHPNEVFKHLISALSKQKDIAIGIKIQGTLAFKLSKVTKGILPDLLLKASAQLMLAANVKESESMYNGLYIRAHIDATSIANFIQTLANLFTIGGKQGEVKSIMDQVRNNLVAQLDVFARGSDASWGFRFQFGSLFKLYFEFTDGSNIKLCANSACINIPLVSCAKYSIGRGVGVPMTVCGEGEEKEGALCYKKCDAGYQRLASTCWKQCDASYTDMGAFCDTGEIGTPISDCLDGKEKIGLLCYDQCPTGWNKEGIACTKPCKSEYIDDGLTCRRPPKSVTADNSGCPWYDKCGLVWKSAKGCTRCPSDYRNDGCVCTRDIHVESQPRIERRPYPLSCPSSKKESGGLCYRTLPKTYTKASYTTKTVLPTCAADLEEQAGLCYKKCESGLVGKGPVCWQSTCPSSYPHDIGAICCKSASKCFIPIIGCSKKNDKTGAIIDE